MDWLREREDQLDDDSRRRLGTNPLRILDTKHPHTRVLLADAPRLQDFLGDEAAEHFRHLCRLLDAAGVPWTFNQNLVRGLDYYGKTVFEWVTTDLGSQGTVCAGGRYDGLVEQLGGKSTPAVGFAMGIERLVLLLETVGVAPDHVTRGPDVYVAGVGNVDAAVLVAAETVRSHCPGARIMTHWGGGSFKSQMKKADRSGAPLVLIMGEDEAAADRITLKYLREDKPQEILPVEQAAERVAQQLEQGRPTCG